MSVEHETTYTTTPLHAAFLAARRAVGLAPVRALLRDHGAKDGMLPSVPPAMAKACLTALRKLTGDAPQTLEDIREEAWAKFNNPKSAKPTDESDKPSTQTLDAAEIYRAWNKPKKAGL